MWLRWLTYFFLGLWIFFIPSSLAYHFNRNLGLVNGILVDYRIPAVTASGIALGILGLLLVITIFRSISQERQQYAHALGKVGVFALVVTLCFQIALGLYQFRMQCSLTGYLPFGEVTYTAPQIVKGVFSGVILKLPYGTTAHPNVLAGFLTLSLLLLFLQPFVVVPKKYKAILFLFVALMCFLTQSLVAASSLLLSAGIYLLVQMGWTRLTRLMILFLPIVSFILFLVPGAESSRFDSIARRAQLQDIAVHMIAANPLTGVGWNNFTLAEEHYGFIPGPIRFLQPVHNVFLLLIAELGLSGLFGLALIRLIAWKVEAKWLPLVGALVFIGSFDHYLITLSTGRMFLLFFFLSVYLSRRHDQKVVIL